MKRNKIPLTTYVTPQFAKQINEAARKSNLSTSMFIQQAIQTLITVQEIGQLPRKTMDTFFNEWDEFADYEAEKKNSDKE